MRQLLKLEILQIHTIYKRGKYATKEPYINNETKRRVLDATFNERPSASIFFTKLKQLQEHFCCRGGNVEIWIKFWPQDTYGEILTLPITSHD